MTSSSTVIHFKKSIQKIRNILRGPGICLTGMDSMRHICSYILCRYMTRQRIRQIGNIPEEMAWEYIMDQSRSGREQDTIRIFCHCISCFDRLFDKDQHAFLFEIQDVQKHVEILTICDVLDMNTMNIDILGWIYEIHMKTGGGGKDMGQYFTDKVLCDYMVNMCKPSLNDIICDPAMGTGGLLKSCMKYLSVFFHCRNSCESSNSNAVPMHPHPIHIPTQNEKTDVEWNRYKNHIHGCDADHKVSKLCRMNLFMESGGVIFDNIVTRNSLYEGLPLPSYDVFLVNMPFGIKGINYERCAEKIRRLHLPGTHSEPLFLQLIMTSMNKGGRCAVIVPDGVLSNMIAQHVGTRKYLLENFELQEVIKLRGNIFMNTSIQPSILFFTHTGSTTHVTFSELYKNPEGILEKKIILGVVPVSRILDSSCSLIAKRYTEPMHTVPLPSNTRNTMSIFDVCTSIVRGKRCLKKSEDENENGYPYHDIAGIKRYVTEYLVEDGEPVILTPSILCLGRFVYSNTRCYPSDNMFILRPNTSIILPEYLYYYCQQKISSDIKTHAVGIKPSIKVSLFHELRIMVPSFEVQQRVVDFMKNQIDVLDHDPRFLDMLLQDSAPCASIMNINAIIRKIRILLNRNYAHHNNMIESFIHGEDTRMCRLGDLFSANKSHINYKDSFSTIRYIDLSSIHKGSLVAIKEIDFEDRPTRAYRKVETNDILWGTVRPSSRKHLLIEKDMILPTESPLIASSGFVVLHNEHPNIVLSRYMYMILTSNKCVEYLENHTHGTMFPSFSPTALLDYEVPLISIANQERMIHLIDQTDDIVHYLDDKIKTITDQKEIMYHNYESAMHLGQESATRSDHLP